ncbi:MAG: hypothetical protein LUC38_00915 [Oscillospiraceae bacterium]|nr:hypothetical protein [Oscillospiraceae bacterium]
MSNKLIADKSKTKDNPHEGHRQRLRKQFLNYGLDRFYDHQALELLLFYTNPRGDTNPTAHALLNRFGSIANVLNAPYEDLLEVDGVGDNTACLLKLLPEFFAKYMLSGLDGERLETTSDLCRYFLYKLSSVQIEQLWIICLDDKMGIVSSRKISEGDGSSVSLNELKIINEICKSKCTSCAIAHNHPLGNTEPSREDTRLTESLKKSLEGMGINLADHVIVSHEEARSMFKNEVVRLEDNLK